MMLPNKLVPVVLVKNEEFWLPYCLESVAGHFDRMVIYDVGSEDRTPDIINWFVDKEKHRTDFFVRMLPDCNPKVQGAFRNSMIAEAESEYYFILDGDEVWNLADLNVMKRYVSDELEKPYGIVKRVEVNSDLTQRYADERSHHRIYHRDMYWRGTHPGEVPVFEQTPSREQWIEGPKVWHFHNTLRSTKEKEAHKRIARKSQQTYHPGDLVSFNLLENVPILSKPIANWPVCPALKALHDQV